MRSFKLFVAIIAVAGLIVFGVFQFHSVKAESEDSSQIPTKQNPFTNGQQILPMMTGNNGESGNKNNNNFNTEGPQLEGKIPQGGPSLTINSAQRAMINGASLVSNSGQSLTVSIFGLNLNLAITSSTVLLGTASTASSSIADMKTGDSIDATGQIDATSGIITVKQMRDRNMQQLNIQSIQQQIQMLLEQIKKLQAQLHM